MKQEPKPALNYSPSPGTSKQDGCPPAKKIRMDIEETLARLKSLDTPSQLELWRRMLTTHPFNLDQLKLLRTAIDDRIKLDIVSAVPYEIALYIMSFLCPKDLCQAAQTCRSWRVVCEDNRLWREKCREEGLMDDEQAMSILFKERIENSTKIHQKFAMDCLSITSDSSDWKVAYLKHMNVLRNWRSRAFKVKEPTLTDIPPPELHPCLTPQPTQPQPAQMLNAQYPAADQPVPLAGLDADEFRQLYELLIPPDSNPLQRVAAPQRRPPEKAKRQVARPPPDLALRFRTIRQQQMRQLPQRLKQARQCPQIKEQQLQKPQQQNLVEIPTPEESRSPSCDRGTNQRLMQLRCHEDSVITCLQYNSRTNTVVSGSDDMTLKVWSSETGKCIATLEGHSGGVWSSQLSPEDIVISGATDRTIKIWRAHTGELLRTLHGHSSTVRCLALNGDRVVSGSRDTTLRLWDVETGHCIEVLAGHTQAVRCVEFKGDIIVSGAYDHLVMVWDAKTQQRVHTLDCHANRIYSLQFDGKTIASGSLDSTICIWDVETGKLRQHLEGHSSLTSKMQLKDNILVSANADSYCKVWDVNTGECLRTLEGPNKHTSAITSVYFDTRHVVTSSDDGTVKLWDVNTGEFIRNLIVLPTADKGGVVWRIRASYSKLICAVGSRTETEDTHLLVLDFE